MPTQLKIMVTGSSGTVGTALCEHLLQAGNTVVAVDYKENPYSKQVNNVTVKSDLRNKQSVDNLPNDIDVIIHLAANARVPHSIKNPSSAKDNFEMTFNLLEFARINEIKKFLFSSSKDVYGNFKTYYAEEDVHLEACESPYAASKIGCESLIHSYQKCFGMDYLIIRFSNIYGRYSEQDRLIPIFINLTKQNKDLMVNGADKLLDYIHIDDAISGVMLCVTNFTKIKNQTFNIAFGEGTKLLKIAELVKNKLQGNNNIVVKQSNVGDVIKSVSNISKAKEKLNFTPKIDIETGIAKTIEEYKKMKSFTQ